MSDSECSTDNYGSLKISKESIINIQKRLDCFLIIFKQKRCATVEFQNSRS